MAKPSTLPRWATGGTAQITEPNEGKKDIGWVPLEKPPAQTFNWAMKLIYDWLAYLNGLTGEALNWSAKHTFGAGLTSSVVPSGSTDVARLWEVQQEAVQRQAADSLKANASEVVNLTGAQNVGGVKTFTSPPTVPTPVAGSDAATKTYADARETAAKAYADAKFTSPAWSALTINAAYTAGTGAQLPSVAKDIAGVVHMKGQVTVVTIGGSAVNANLGAGFKPLGERRCAIFNVTTGAFLQGKITVGGQLVVDWGTTTAGHVWDLAGISFVAEQ